MALAPKPERPEVPHTLPPCCYAYFACRNRRLYGTHLEPRSQVQNSGLGYVWAMLRGQTSKSGELHPRLVPLGLPFRHIAKIWLNTGFWSHKAKNRLWRHKAKNRLWGWPNGPHMPQKYLICVLHDTKCSMCTLFDTESALDPGVCFKGVGQCFWYFLVVFGPQTDTLRHFCAKMAAKHRLQGVWGPNCVGWMVFHNSTTRPSEGLLGPSYLRY